MLGIVLLAACSGEPAAEAPKNKERPPVPVKVAQVLTREVSEQVATVGTVEAYATVAVKSRVGGEIVAVHFQEGQEVKQGDLLFTIDKAPYEVALKEARARLARNQALARKATDDLGRNAPLAQKGLLSQQNLEQFKSTADAAEASVKGDEAAIENLQLQLGYCSIRAPITGRTGSLLAHRGNLVKANDENKSLIAIHQIQPIYAAFAVPEQYLPKIQKAMADKTLAVEARIPDVSSRHQPVPGTVTFIDSAVDVGTATIRIKASFPNQDRRLWPGQVLNLALTLGVQRDAVVVPGQAVQSGQSGRFAFVVKPEGTVEMRPVVVARNTNGEAVIEEGLKPGETVVTDGQILLTPGARVSVKETEKGQEGKTGQ